MAENIQIPYLRNDLIFITAAKSQLFAQLAYLPN